jgi:hypothetical protein
MIRFCGRTVAMDSTKIGGHILISARVRTTSPMGIGNRPPHRVFGVLRVPFTLLSLP